MPKNPLGEPGTKLHPLNLTRGVRYEILFAIPYAVGATPPMVSMVQGRGIDSALDAIAEGPGNG